MISKTPLSQQDYPHTLYAFSIFIYKLFPYTSVCLCAGELNKELVQLYRTFTLNVGQKPRHFDLNTSDFLDWPNPEKCCSIFHTIEAKILILKVMVFRDWLNWSFHWLETTMSAGLGQSIPCRSCAGPTEFFIPFLEALRNHPAFFCVCHNPVHFLNFIPLNLDWQFLYFPLLLIFTKEVHITWIF